MPSMIENLMGSGVRRRDEKRLTPTRRPLPTRARDLMELFAALGSTASLRSLILSADFREAEPRHLTFIALGRWPSADELQSQPDPYEVGAHLRTLLFGQEFRDSLFRRICDAYPERPRLFYIGIPRCAGHHFLKTTAPMHPLFAFDLATWRRGEGEDFIAALGTYLARFNTTKTIMVALSSQLPAIGSPKPPEKNTGETFPWSLNPPPYRAGDRLFAILREPRSLILSLVNAQLGQAAKAATAEDLKQHGRHLLRSLTHRNPICTALGDGSAAGALALCRRTDIELADLSRYPTWIRYTWDTDTEPPTNCSFPTLLLEDLDASDTGWLESLIDEDLIFYQRFAAALENLPSVQTSIRGRHL